MIERCLGVRRSRKMYRFLRHCKVTFACLVLTIIVLRGIIGAGRFGTPEQDLEVIRKRFYSRKRSAGETESNVNTFNASKWLADEQDGGDDEGDGLGPKISNWDEKRANWIKMNQNFRNFVGPMKPRVLLVTGSCEDPIGDHYLFLSMKNKADYCKLHGIELFNNTAPVCWTKLPLIRKLLLSHPEVEFLWSMESDALFTDMAFEVPWKRYKDINLVMHERNGSNTGSFLLRNCQWSLDILEAWAPMSSRKGKIRTETGKIPTKELEESPASEADDDLFQSAMVYLSTMQKDKWRAKVYTESCTHFLGRR